MRALSTGAGSGRGGGGGREFGARGPRGEKVGRRGQRVLVPVAVLERVDGGDALRGKVGEKAVEELEAALGEHVSGRGEARFERVVRVFGELELLPDGQLGQAGPNALARSAEVLEDHLQLLHLVAPAPQRLHEQELGEDAADAPEVHRRRVLLHEIPTSNEYTYNSYN